MFPGERDLADFERELSSRHVRQVKNFDVGTAFGENQPLPRDGERPRKEPPGVHPKSKASFPSPSLPARSERGAAA